MGEVRPRKGDLEAATTPHPFQPSGEYVGASRAERCDLCGLAQRGVNTMPCALHGYTLDAAPVTATTGEAP